MGLKPQNAQFGHEGLVVSAIGTLLGMYLFSHKTQHKKFTLGAPNTDSHDGY